MSDIDSMEAGPELDRLVAQALLNYRGRDQPPTCMGVIDTGTWSPSSVISHAWEVVEKMRLSGHRPRIDSTEDGDGWTANFPTQGEMGDLCWRHDNSVADTAPLAICRAALKAMA